MRTLALFIVFLWIAPPLSQIPSGAYTSPPSSGIGVVAKADATAQAANIAGTTLYTVPAGAGGMYRLSGYTVVTQAATTSSTLPNISVSWTDVDSSTSEAGFSITGTSTANTVGQPGITGVANSLGTLTINAKAGTLIQYATANYASVGATPMQYAIHVKLEYLGQ